VALELQADFMLSLDALQPKWTISWRKAILMKL
jgi:hypothetical protein